MIKNENPWCFWLFLVWLDFFSGFVECFDHQIWYDVLLGRPRLDMESRQRPMHRGDVPIYDALKRRESWCHSFKKDHTVWLPCKTQSMLKVQVECIINFHSTWFYSIWISNPCDALAVLLGWDASIPIFTSAFVSFQTSLNLPPFDRLKDPEWSSKKWTDITLHLLLISWFQSRLHFA